MVVGPHDAVVAAHEGLSREVGVGVRPTERPTLRSGDKAIQPDGLAPTASPGNQEKLN